MSSASIPKPGTLIAKKYRVVRPIGSGGMGLVVLATHVDLGERVALKFLHPEHARNDQVAARFLREGRSAFRIRSEHVARVIDAGRLDDGASYLAMEYLEGRDLAAQLSRHGPLPVRDAVDYVIQACEAVAASHALGIVHRDLKPANLFLTMRPDGTPSIKVLDFGISKVARAAPGETETGLTGTVQRMGSPSYMSPEQMTSSRDVDGRTDVWALGVVLFELLSGKLPFSGGNVADVGLKVLRDPPASLIALAPTVPKELEVAIVRCLEKKPDDRFDEVDELAEALVPFASEPLGRTYADRIHRILTTPAENLRSSNAAVTSDDVPPPSFDSDPVDSTGHALRPLRYPSTFEPKHDQPTVAPSSTPIATTPRRGGRPIVVVIIAAAAAFLGVAVFVRLARPRLPAQSPSAPSVEATPPHPSILATTPAMPPEVASSPPPTTTSPPPEPSSIAAGTSHTKPTKRPKTGPPSVVAKPSAPPGPTDDPFGGKKE